MLPILETQTKIPLSFYGLSKFTAEKYISMYNRTYGLDYVIFRFSNVFGERQGDSGEGGVISIFAKQIASQKNSCKIFGDGSQTRDFIYVGDVACGIYNALYTKNINTVYNLSTSTETSINQLIEYFSDIITKKIDVEYEPARKGDIYRSILSNEKAISKLNWKPQVSLKDGLIRTYKYFFDKINVKR